MHFQPIIPWPWLAGTAVLAIVLVGLDIWRLQRTHQARQLAPIGLLGALTLMALIAFLARPCLVTRKPQLEKLKTAVLVDVSASMNTPCENSTRLREAQELLNHEPSRRFLNRSQRIDYLTFARETAPLAPGPNRDFSLTSSPGNTRLGEALQSVLKLSEQGTPYATVLLVSDGRNVDGISPIPVAKQFKARKIPVSTVCFTGGERLPDAQVTAPQETISAVRDRPFTITAKLKATTASFKNLKLQLLANNQVLDEKTLDLEPDQTRNMTMTATLPLAGNTIMTLKIKPGPKDVKPDNDLDFVTVKVQEPPTFNLLYLDYGLDWEWKFFRRQADRNKQLNLAAVIQLAKEKFYVTGLDRNWTKKPEFPQHHTQLENVDVIIASATCLEHLTLQQQETIRAFVEHKGGGLIVRGLLRNMPDRLKPLLPDCHAETLDITRPRTVRFRHDLIYRQDSAKHLSPQGGTWLQPGNAIAVIGKPSPATRIIATLDGDRGKPVMAVHAFGAGRVAFLGIPQTWQWAMDGKQGEKLHETLWTQLVVWLAQAAKPMVSISRDGTRIPVAEPQELDVDVLGSNFKPDPEATVTAVIAQPNGQQLTVTAMPHPDEAGRYVFPLTPQWPGEYAITVQVRGKQNQHTAKATLLAVMDTRETNQVQSDEQLMRDIARITGGKPFTPNEFRENYANTPVSQNVPVKEDTEPLLPSWSFVIIAMATTAATWWMRRRLGLK